AVVNPRRDLDLELRLLAHAALAVAVLARIVDDRALALALRAGLRHREEALRELDTAGAAALRAALRLRTRLGAGAAARAARLGARELERHLHALKRVLERQ